MRIQFALAAAVTVAGFAASAQAVVVPNNFGDVDAPSTFAGPLSRFARTYQLLIDESQMQTVSGQQIVGVTWRLPSTGSAWPAANVNYNDFDIYLGPGVDPTQRSLTLAQNAAGPQVQVRAGALTIPAGSFLPRVGTEPAPFGYVIEFDTPYLYTGGDLLLELRQSSHDGTDRSVDAAATTSPGYGTAYSALWGSGYTATEGLQGNAIVTSFVTVIPEPASLSLLTAATLAGLRRRR